MAAPSITHPGLLRAAEGLSERWESFQSGGGVELQQSDFAALNTAIARAKTDMLLPGLIAALELALPYAQHSATDGWIIREAILRAKGAV